MNQVYTLLFLTSLALFASCIPEEEPFYGTDPCSGDYAFIGSANENDWTYQKIHEFNYFIHPETEKLITLRSMAMFLDNQAYSYNYYLYYFSCHEQTSYFNSAQHTPNEQYFKLYDCSGSEILSSSSLQDVQQILDQNSKYDGEFYLNSNIGSHCN